TDRLNGNHGLFTGGSQVLVSGRLSLRRLRFVTGLVLIAVLAVAGAILSVAPAPLATLSWLLLAVVLTLGYSVSPLRLCYRGLGELDVCFTHSPLVLVLGGLLQGGGLLDGD